MANKNVNGDVNVSFTEAASRQTLDSGESVKTLFGKLRKWLSDLKPVAFSGSYNDLSNKPTLGTAAAKNVASSGNASTSQVVMGNDSRLSDSRPASDVSSWAKASTKPTYTAGEVGAAPASHTQASSTITAMTGYTKPSSTSAITTSDTLNEAIGKLEKGLDSAGGGSPFIKIYDTAYYDRLRITFKKSTFSCALFLQTIKSSGMSYVCGDQSIIRICGIAAASSASSIVSTGTGSISGNSVTISAKFIRTIHIPADVLSQISKVEINARGTGPVPSDVWETIYEA